MQNFRTEIKPKNCELRISHQDKILLIGSCFAENIGEKLLQTKFDASINPYGILFNPLSICQCLHHIINQRVFSEEDLCFDGEEWYSFQHHSIFNHSNQQQCLSHINQVGKDSFERLCRTDLLILTLGSAFAYKHIASNCIVANCHKVPAKQFERILLSVEDISAHLTDVIKRIRQINPHMRILLTISPIRYVKYDMEENALSKAHLLTATHQLISRLENVFYFPSFEIMMDDLRDYRFYQADMIHPSEVAIDYMWEKFSTCYFDNNTLALNKEIAEISAARQHKIKHTASEETKKFAKTQLNKINSIKKRYPFIDYHEEETYFLNLIQ